MQCFICVIYLIIYCKAQTTKQQELTATLNNLVHPSKISSSNDIDDVNSATQLMDETGTSSKPYLDWNKSQSKISEDESESMNEEKIVHGDSESVQTTKYPSVEGIKEPEPSKQIYTGISKENVKLLIAGVNRSEPAYTPILNTMEGMSHIGDSDLLAIINPTVVVSRESDIKFGLKKKDKKKHKHSDVANGEII